MPTHDSSSNAAVEASIAFTKQLALSFIALVLMLFIVVSERNRHTPQYTSAANVKGVTEEIRNVDGQRLQNSPILTCDICQRKYGKKTLCMEPTRKRSYCGNSCTAGSIGGRDGVCSLRPTEKPWPTGWPRPSVYPTWVKPSPPTVTIVDPYPTTCPPYRIQDPPPQGCTYVWPSPCYGTQCSPCPQPKLICTQSPTNTPAIRPVLK